MPIYDWIYENCVNTLNQITHMHFDFATLKGLKIPLGDGKKTEREGQGREDNRVEEVKTDIPVLRCLKIIM